MKKNFTQKIKFDHITVATPTIAASNSDTSYEISGASVILTCTSTSDSDGIGTYIWKLNTQFVYVCSIINITCILILPCGRYNCKLS